MATLSSGLSQLFGRGRSGDKARRYPREPSRDSAWGRTVFDRTVVHIPDIERHPEIAASLGFHDILGFRSDLTTALDRQTATAEILRVTSQSGADVQPVFDVIAEISLRLLRGWSSIIWRVQGDGSHVGPLAGVCRGVGGATT